MVGSAQILAEGMAKDNRRKVDLPAAAGPIIVELAVDQA